MDRIEKEKIVEGRQTTRCLATRGGGAPRQQGDIMSQKNHVGQTDSKVMLISLVLYFLNKRSRLIMLKAMFVHRCIMFQDTVLAWRDYKIVGPYRVSSLNWTGILASRGRH
jgi:hypothetical protein